MRTFRCACGARVFFENHLCTACGRELGFVPERGVLCAITPADGAWVAHDDGSRHRKCRNHVEQGVCNWLVPAEDPHDLCRACRLNRVVPDLSHAESRARWADMETAKRRLLYSLHRLRLPVVSRSESPDGLAFDIKADLPGDPVLTGHADGLITLDVAEADPVVRERTRVAMAERYRTLLGHFRHEIGHYYWARLVRDSEWLEPFRALFGDERRDYASALREHHASWRTDWVSGFISAYASAHPWEDWAETWAHYLHMADTLETAHHFGLVGDAGLAEPLADADFGRLLAAWRELTVALNALNRSMGMPDPYPFQTGPAVDEKLAFVHRVVGAAGRGGAGPEAPPPPS